MCCLALLIGCIFVLVRGTCHQIAFECKSTLSYLLVRAFTKVKGPHDYFFAAARYRAVTSYAA